MITERIHRVLSRIKGKGGQLPQSALGKAIDYTLTMWPMLTVYLEDGRVKTDNNPVENAIRPNAIGKKTGYSSARPKPDNAAPSSSRSSKPVAVEALIRRLICANCSPACRH